MHWGKTGQKQKQKRKISLKQREKKLESEDNSDYIDSDEAKKGIMKKNMRKEKKCGGGVEGANCLEEGHQFLF